MSTDPLLAFNNQVDLKNAYVWPSNQVLGFLSNVNEDPDKYGVPDENKPALGEIARALLSLSYPLGQNYGGDKSLQPDQHVYRRQNLKSEGKNSLGIPKLLVRKFPPQNKYEAQWVMYDLLGMFLSLMGPSPDAANWYNFYLPLTVLYGHWCHHFRNATTSPTSSKVPKVPTMLQCTWNQPKQRSGSQGPSTYYLGASMGGEACMTAPRSKDPWIEHLQRTRFALVDDPQLANEGYSFDKPRTVGPDGVARQKFGNCAETFPFLALMKLRDGNGPSCRGFALRLDKIPETYPALTTNDLTNPCLNCECLIKWRGGNAKNFKPFFLPYIFDLLFDPPMPPRKSYIPGQSEGEDKSVPSLFSNKLSTNWKVVYRQRIASTRPVFTSLNWAAHRLRDDLKPSGKVPASEKPDDPSTHTVDDYVKGLAKQFKLATCADNDADRMVVIWSPSGQPTTVGHVQVKYNNNWESKIPAQMWTITHEENDFQYLAAQKLIKVKTLKKS